MTVDHPEHETHDVDAWLRTLAEDDASVTAPPELRARVLASWDTRDHASPRVASRWWPSFAPVAAAAALIVIVVGIWLLARSPLARRAEDDRRKTTGAPSALVNDGALAMATMVEPPLETESLQIVRVRMPRGALRAFGVPLLEPDAAAEVEVDLIVGDDGLLRSIQRVQPVSMTNQERMK